MDLMTSYIEELNKLNFKNMYNNDFLLTWEKTYDEIFITPLDINLLKEQSSCNNFKNLFHTLKLM